MKGTGTQEHAGTLCLAENREMESVREPLLWWLAIGCNLSQLSVLEECLSELGHFFCANGSIKSL